VCAFFRDCFCGLGLGLEDAGLGLGLGLETTGLGLGLETLVLTTRLKYSKLILCSPARQGQR